MVEVHGFKNSLEPTPRLAVRVDLECRDTFRVGSIGVAPPEFLCGGSIDRRIHDPNRHTISEFCEPRTEGRIEHDPHGVWRGIHLAHVADPSFPPGLRSSPLRMVQPERSACSSSGTANLRDTPASSLKSATLSTGFFAKWREILARRSASWRAV